MPVVCATTAQFPGLSVQRALSEISSGVHEGVWGLLSSAHIQLCPQSAGILSEEEVERLASAYPQSQLRLHANARVLNRHVLWDASMFSNETKEYYVALTDRMLRLNSSVFSIHAGYLEHCPPDKFWDRVEQVRECVDSTSQGRVSLAIEGLYPSRHHAQHISSWTDYEELLKRGVPFALDLSHLNIVAHSEKTWNSSLVREMMTSSGCKEIHVSDNDGRGDRHLALEKTPRWWDDLHDISLDADCIVFSEGNLIPRKISVL